MLLPERAGAQPFDVVGVQPEQNSIVAQATDTVAVTFQNSIAADPPEIDVSGSQFGKHDGEVEVESNTLRFISNCPFRPGETVTVTISDAGKSYVWQFTVRSEFGNGEFSPEDPVTLGGVSTESEMSKVGSVVIPSEPYAGYINGDLLADVAIVNQEAEQIEIRYASEISGSVRLDGSEADSISVGGAKTLAGGDLNGNGRPGFVTANTFADSLSIVLNQGGSIQLEEKIPTGPRPTDLTIADLDGDGDQDVAVTPFGGNSVYVHLNDGTGTFQSPDLYDAGPGPSSIIARDIDNDADLDLLVGSTGEQSIEFLENDGDGGFTRSDALPLGFTPATLTGNDVIGDNGADGLVDLIVSAQSEDQIVLYENDGAGSFSFTQQSIPSPDAPARGATLSDVDAGDESPYDLDFLSAHRSANTVQLALNQSNSGGYAPSADFFPDEPVGVVNLDVDRDEAQDFVVFDARGTTSQLFKNQGGRPGEPAVVLSEELLFGGVCVGGNSTKTIQVENITNNDVEVRESAVPEGFEVESSLPVTLRPDETRTLEITFAPDEIRGYSGDVELEMNELTGDCGETTESVFVSVQVQGTGEGTDLSATPDTLDFGEVTVGNSSSESFDVLNEGNINADIQAVEGLDGTPFEVTDTPSTIPPGGEGVTVQFSPDTPNNDPTATVSLITSSDCGQDTVEVVLTGSSVPKQPDLVAEELRAVDAPDVVNVSDTLDIVCEVSSQGGQDVENPFDVSISQDDSRLETFNYPNGLDVGETIQTAPPVSVPLSSDGLTEFTCEADVEGVIDEQDENNNIARLEFNVQRPDQLPVSPNPFTPNGDDFNDRVEFRVSEFGLDQATVEIYTFQGRLVRTLDEIQDGGVLEWDGRDDSGERLSPGVYLYVLRSGGQDAASGHVTLAL